MSTDATNVVTLPVQFRPHVVGSDSPPPYPRASFGLRPAMELARDADREQQERIKRLAREARNALDGRAVDPDLIRDLAIEVGHVAQQCEALAQKSKAWGALKAAVSLREHAHLIETLSAELLAEVTP